MNTGDKLISTGNKKVTREKRVTFNLSAKCVVLFLLQEQHLLSYAVMGGFKPVDVDT